MFFFIKLIEQRFGTSSCWLGLRLQMSHPQSAESVCDIIIKDGARIVPPRHPLPVLRLFQSINTVNGLRNLLALCSLGINKLRQPYMQFVLKFLYIRISAARSIFLIILLLVCYLKQIHQKHLLTFQTLYTILLMLHLKFFNFFTAASFYDNVSFTTLKFNSEANKGTSKCDQLTS